MAQNRQDPTRYGKPKAKGMQENLGALYQLWEKPKTRKDKLGNASISSWTTRGGERR